MLHERDIGRIPAAAAKIGDDRNRYTQRDQDQADEKKEDPL